LSEGPRSVTALAVATGLKQPNVSDHLEGLRARGIVTSRRDGRFVLYQFSSPEIEAEFKLAMSRTRERTPAEVIRPLADAYCDAIIAGDESRCRAVMEASVPSHISMLDTYQDILCPAIARVYELFNTGALDETVRRRAHDAVRVWMSRMVKITGRMAPIAKTALLAATPNASHYIGQRMLGDLMAARGWRTQHMSANLPMANWRETIRRPGWDVLVLSCPDGGGVEDTRAVLRALCASTGSRTSPRIGVCGFSGAFNPEDFAHAGADFTPRSLREFATDFLPQLENQDSAIGGMPMAL
jgi:methanogenic corrinoid protein MtbC1